uniref:WT1 interacting protein n=1 Tax=Sphenodon punctatus TaxID=8508 RepID=A0A8D0GSS7_SPHPU
MEKYEEELVLQASKFMEDLSLYEACKDGLYGGSSSRREPDLERGITAAAVAAFRTVNGSSRGGSIQQQQEPGACCEEGPCTRSEVALPCYKRYSSSESYRYNEGSGGGVYMAKPGGSYLRGHATSPRSSLASSSCPEPCKFSSPRSSLSGGSALPCCYEKFSSPRSSLFSSPRSSLVPSEGSALSPRSSYASTASDTSKHSSPRASLTGYDCSSKPSSNRTSGISMGYDQRHLSPRSSTASQYSGTTSPRSSYSDSRYGPAAAAATTIPGNPDLEGAAGVLSPRASLCSQDGRSGAAPGSCCPNASVISPRSSISSHSSRSSRSSRGSMSAYPELQLPSPRASLLLSGLQHQQDESNLLLLPELGEAYHKLHGQAPGDSGPAAPPPYTYCPAGKPAPKFKLPYQVTPSRESGPSQAERRLEALTLELEKELEMHMKKEYFGICIKCAKGVYGASQACQAMGNLYHTNCFTCCSCGRRLRGKAFYNVNGKVYCEEDFLYSGFQQTADKCFVCGHLIMEMILQALGKSYHPGCFRCVVCNECLDGVPFTVDVENNIYCKNDKILPTLLISFTLYSPNQGSEETIRVVSMDRDYHVECYHCEDCGLQLNDEEGHRCYPLEGHLLCHTCHIRRLNIQVPPHPPPSYPMHVTEL